MRWTWRPHSKCGNNRSSWNCGVRWKHDWANADGESMCKCCGCWGPASLTEVRAAIGQALRFPAIAAASNYPPIF